MGPEDPWNHLTISDRLAETEFLEGERADLPVLHCKPRWSLQARKKIYPDRNVPKTLEQQETVKYHIQMFISTFTFH